MDEDPDLVQPKHRNITALLEVNKLIGGLLSFVVAFRDASKGQGSWQQNMDRALPSEMGHRGRRS